MRHLRQFGLIIGINFIGEFIHRILKVPLPGSIIGMIILFILLYTGIIKVEKLKEVSSFLIDNMAFLFVPAGVGLYGYFALFKSNFLAIVSICLITTIIVMIAAGHAVQLMKRGRNK